MNKLCKSRGLPKNRNIGGSEKSRGFTKEMDEKIIEFGLTLHGIADNSKELYISKLKRLGEFLKHKRDITRFEDAKTIDLNLFLAKYNSKYTFNVCCYVIKKFYCFLNLEHLTTNFRYYKINPEQITPSETLTPTEVIQIANQASKRRELYKVLILTLFESCARISELLQLKLGDVIFSSVIDKENNKPKPIATLHFKRSKGGIKKQPVVIVMFSSELKRWCDNHPNKGDDQAYLFPSPRKTNKPITNDSISTALWNAGNKLGINKRLNPHWLRHSGLSYFVNDKNYNEQLLKWRAGWTNTSMASRYIHSGAELENNAYLERMNLSILEDETKPKRIVPKTCPHCQSANPYTNTNCDLCAMPLDVEQYQKEIERRREIEQFHAALKKTATGKLTQEHKVAIKEQVEVLATMMEYGYSDEVKVGLEALLTKWAKVLLAK